jgi:hypothetical protein
MNAAHRRIGTSLSLACALLIFVGLVPADAGAALSSVPDKDWVTNGPVNAIATSGNTIYLGGSFTEVGPRTGPAATFSSGSSTPDAPGFPEVAGGEGQVHTAISDGAGGWYIGGSFTTVGGVARSDLAHVLAGGTVDPTFAPSFAGNQPTAVVQSLALSGSTLYVGGSFSEIDGATRRLAAINVTDGSLQSWNPVSNASEILSLAVSGGTLYVGGSFSTMEGKVRDGVAAFNTTSGALTTWAPEITFGTGSATSSGEVFALAVSGATVYIAGYFEHVNGEARSAFAAVSITGTLTGWNPKPSGCASGSPNIGTALAVTAAAVYVGGCFTEVGGQARTDLAAVEPSTGTATSWNPHLSPHSCVLCVGAAPPVTSLAATESLVYVSGGFQSIGGQTRNGLAALELSTANATAWNPKPNISDPLVTGVLTVSVGGSSVFVGGSFSSLGGVTRHNLAAVDATTGEATSWNPDAEPPPSLPSGPTPPLGFVYGVDALVVSGGEVYVGGTFAEVGGGARENLAALDPVTGKATSWNPGASGGVGWLAAATGLLYVGGGGGLRAVSTTTGTATSWAPAALKGTLNSLILSGSTLYVGGLFTELGGQSRTSLGALSTTTGAALSWDPKLEGPFGAQADVASMALAGSRVYVDSDIGGGTQFTTAAFDATSGEPVAWLAADESLLTSPALAVANGAVYRGGTAADASSGLSLAWHPEIAGATTIVTTGTHVYVGGRFSTTGGAAASGFASYTFKGPVNNAAPTISGIAGEGQTLSEHHGVWSGSPTGYTYQWLSCRAQPPFSPFACTPIPGATGQSYTVPGGESGTTIEVEETAANTEGASDPVSSLATATVLARPTNSSPPVITGTASVGATLGCSPGTWSNGPTSYTYDWQRDEVPIPGATTSTYTVTKDDIGHALACAVTASNAAGSGEAIVEAGTVPAGAEGGGSGTPNMEPRGGGGTTTSQGGGGSAVVAGQSGPSASAVQAALTVALKRTKPSRIAGLLKAGGYSLAFIAPGSGVLSIQWDSAATEARGRRVKPVILATGSESFSAAGSAMIRLRLTSAGRRLLRKGGTLRLTETATFTPTSGTSQTTRTSFSLRR